MNLKISITVYPYRDFYTSHHPVIKMYTNDSYNVMENFSFTASLEKKIMKQKDTYILRHKSSTKITSTIVRKGFIESTNVPDIFA